MYEYNPRYHRARQMRENTHEPFWNPEVNTKHITRLVLSTVPSAGVIAQQYELCPCRTAI